MATKTREGGGPARPMQKHSEMQVYETAVSMLKARGLSVSSGTSQDMWYLVGTPPQASAAAPISTNNAKLDKIFTACGRTVVVRTGCISNGHHPKNVTFLQHFIDSHFEILKKREKRGFTDPLDKLASLLKDVPRIIFITDEVKTSKTTERLYFRLEKKDLKDGDSLFAACRTFSSHGAIAIYKYVEIFTDRALRFNVLNHKLVPRHRAITRAELNALATKYTENKGIRREDMEIAFAETLPAIHYLDPVARALGGVPANCPVDDMIVIEGDGYVPFSGSNVGTIFEIMRGNGEIAYRKVVTDLAGKD